MWLSGRRVDSDNGTQPIGNLAWARPTPATIPDGGTLDLLLPSAVSILNEKTAAQLYNGDLYTVGGYTQNLRITKQFNAVVLGITPPSVPLVTGTGTGNQVGCTVVSGPGLTAEVIVYLSWWDELTQETSPLSAASPTLTLANQLITLNNLPISKPEDDFKIPGTTAATAATTITGVGTSFLRDVRPGDKISLSSNPTVFSTVTYVDTDTQLRVATALGDGTSQTITVRRIMRPTHILVWYSVDGGLPRVADKRQVGCVTTTPPVVTIGDLGEAFTEDFTMFPKCLYAWVYHDRLYMTGNPQDPKAIYCSLIGFLERMSSLTLNTKSGNPTTGLYQVRDTLFVGLAQGHDRIQGYTDDDISIDSVAPNLGSQPGLGLLSHFSVGITPDGNAFISTQYGPYLNDGASFYPMNQKIRSVWTRDLQNRPEVYANAFAYVDAERHVYALWMGQHPLIPKARVISTTAQTGTTEANFTQDIVGDGTAFETDFAVGDQISLSSDPTDFATIVEITDDENMRVDLPIGDGTTQTIGLRGNGLISLNAYLVLDYKSVLPIEGGGMGQPKFSWDTQAREDEFAAVLLLPGARNGTVVTGSCDGAMYRRNVPTAVDDSGDIGLKRFYIVHGAEDYGDIGGDFMHGKKLTYGEFYVSDPLTFFAVDLYPGDEYAWPSPATIDDGGNYRGPIVSYNQLGNSQLLTSVVVNGVTHTGVYEDKTVWTIPLRGVSGRRLTLALRAYSTGDLTYFGHTVFWTEGPAPRRVNRFSN